MKKFLNIFFVILGVIFLILILMLAGAYLVIAGPFKALLFEQGTVETIGGDAGGSVDKHPMLNESQEKALETFGIDPASVPSEISPEQEACFEEKLGKERVDEIKAGDSPTAEDFFKAQGCL